MTRRENLLKALWDHEGTGPEKTINGEQIFFPYDDSDDKLNDVIGEEGDIVGDCTIGPGINLTQRGLKKSEIDFILSQIIDGIENTFRRKLDVWNKLNMTRQNVLIEMAYHLGINGFFDFDQMIKALRSENYQQAADEILKSKAGREFPDRYKNLATRLENSVPYPGTG